MKETSYQASSPNFKNCRHLLIHPTTMEVDELNNYIFHHYAKNWAYRHSFFPVVRLLEDDELSIKLYYHELLRSDRRQLEELCGSCYKAVFPSLKYSTCNIIDIPIYGPIDKEDVLKCNSMKHLESIYLCSLSDESYVGCNDSRGGVTINIIRLYNEFYRWNDLINEGYLDPDYEAKCREQLSDNNLGIINNTDAPKAVVKESKTIGVQVFYKTGGEQPSSLDADAVNKFFKGNYAKVWAMMDGYISTFKSYEDGKIYFDVITDPRCKDDGFFLSRHIAAEYRSKVTLLKDATTFQAFHFKANDIIGFLIKENEADLLEEYQARIKKSNDELSNNPDYIHGGQIR